MDGHKPDHLPAEHGLASLSVEALKVCRGPVVVLKERAADGA
eukprot:SAG22_NODE_2051_length_3077_cov_41.063465_2_plen_42_part_00